MTNTATFESMTEGQMVLGEGDVEHLPRAAMAAAMRGDVERADAAELEHLRRTRYYVERKDGECHLAVPQRLIRAYGPSGQLAVEWCTMGGMVYTDIDGKEI